MSSFSTNLAYIAKIGAKLGGAKSAKDSMTDQWQNFNDITGSFNVPGLLAPPNKASSNEVPLSEAPPNKVSPSDSEAAELPALYQCLDCSRVNIRTWHCRMCHMSMYKVLKLCQITKDIDIDDMSASKQFCEVCIQDKSHKHVSKASQHSIS